ncbi:phage capsid protein [Streptomyces sp. NPDC060187]|uniref:phage capsid protein n=1 Tax=Streptomyces sp. NPDC060187 TaxID=3347067 RepID=UPI00365F82E0
MVTRSKKGGVLEARPRRAAYVQQLPDVSLFGQLIVLERPQVEFGSGGAESMQSIATTLDLINRAGAVSAHTRVKILHREWDDTAVKTEAAAILAETGAAAPDPVGTFPLTP